jgi:hypothetical protein
MHLLWNSGRAAVIAATLLAAAPAAAATFNDGAFNASDYVLASYASAGVGTSLGQTASGNPDTALEGDYAAPGANPAGVLFTALNSTFVYDPSVSGAITSLSASLDRYFSPLVDGQPSTVGSYSLRILAEQDGALYQSIFIFGPFNAPGGSWQTLGRAGILASDFKLFDPLNFGAPGVTTGLDYSGDAITFGFAMRASGAVDGNGQPVSTPSSGVLRADNFRIDISAAPEPSGWALMLAGFGVLGAALRRRPALAAPLHG